MNKNQKGFGAIEGLLILIIVGMVGFIGWYVYHSKNNTDKTLNSAANTNVSATTTGAKKATNPYDGWKTATLKYEKMTFQYPGDWTLTNNAYALGTGSDPDSADPGSDDALLTTPNNEKMIIEAGVTHVGSSGSTQVASVPISSPGNSYYISISTMDPSDTTDSPIFGCLSSSPSSWIEPPSKNITLAASAINSHTPTNNFCFLPETVDGQPVNETAAVLQSDPNFAIAKLIFESFKY